MATNRWRGDALSEAKTLVLLAPNNTSAGLRVVVTIGNKTLEFDGWDAAEIVAAIDGSGFPEFGTLTAAVSGEDVSIAGPEDTDFDVGLELSPTVEITEFNQGNAALNQQTRLSFDGATGGSFVLTCNGETTAAINLKSSGTLNAAGVVSAIDALTSFATADVSVSIRGGGMLIEWQGAYAATPVSVTMNATGLNNGGEIVISEVQRARPATHDIWFLGTEIDFEFDISDGTTAVTLKSNESDAQIAAKLSDAWGGEVGVYSDLTAGVLVPKISERIFFLDMVGFPGVTTTLTLSSIDPAVGPPQGVGLEKVVDRTDATSSEILLVDLRAGSISATVFGETISDWARTTIVDALDSANEFRSWSIIGTTSSDLTNDVTSEDLYLLAYDSPSVILAGDVGGEDFPDIVQTDGDGSITVLQNGGATNAAVSAIHQVTAEAVNPANQSALSGSYGLAFPEGEVAGVTPTTSAATLQAAIIAATGITVAVTGAGTPVSPFFIDYTGDNETRALPTPQDVLLTGDGSGTITPERAALEAASASAIVRVSDVADGGSYFLRYGIEGPVEFDWNEDATTFLAALQLFPSLSTPGDVVVSYNSTSLEYLIEFAAGLADQVVSAFGITRNSLTTSANVSIRRLDQAPTGPGNMAEAANWSLGVVPNSGDVIIFDEPVESIRYGLRQFVEVSADISTDVLTAVGGHDLQNGQVIQFLFGDVDMTGVSEAVDYYVISADNLDGTFQVSATEGGTAVDITAAGTGPHYAGLIAGDVIIRATHTADIGIPRRNADGFDEYLERFWRVGIASDGEIVIGDGDGTGASLIRIGCGNSIGQVEARANSISSVLGVPPVLVDALSDGLSVLVNGGDLGIAVYDDEVAKVGEIRIFDGSLAVGSLTVVSNVIAASGSLTTKRMSVSGLIQIQG